MNNYKKVLVVEDEEAVRNEISEILTMENFQVSSATNGLEGLIQAKRNKPDIIVSDIIMPVLNGYQFIQRIKKNPETESIPVIFLSAKTTKDDIRHGMYLGAVSYLTKPLSIDELLQTIKKGLNNPQKSRKTNNTNKENRLSNSTTVKKSKSKNIETLPVIKKIVIKEAKLSKYNSIFGTKVKDVLLKRWKMLVDIKTEHVAEERAEMKLRGMKPDHIRKVYRKYHGLEV